MEWFTTSWNINLLIDNALVSKLLPSSFNNFRFRNVRTMVKLAGKKFAHHTILKHVRTVFKLFSGYAYSFIPHLRWSRDIGGDLLLPTFVFFFFWSFSSRVSNPVSSFRPAGMTMSGSVASVLYKKHWTFIQFLWKERKHVPDTCYFFMSCYLFIITGPLMEFIQSLVPT